MKAHPDSSKEAAYAQCVNCSVAAETYRSSAEDVLKSSIMDAIVKYDEHNMYIRAEDVANEVNHRPAAR